MDKIAEDGFGFLVRFARPANDERVGIFFVTLLMMDFAIDGGELRRDVLNLMIDHALEFRGIAAEGDGREVDDEVALDDLRGKDAVIVVCVAYAGLANPAEKVACAVADLLIAKQNGFGIPAAGLKLRLKSGGDAPADWVVTRAVEN